MKQYESWLMERKLVLATHNKDKARELEALTQGLALDILTLDSFPQVGEIVENGETLEENALIKARTVFNMTGLPSLADDSGLEVYYLNGAPGVFSSRFSGPGATYQSNCRKLLEEMLGVPPRRRYAQFRSVLAFVNNGKAEIVEGVCRGRIAEEPAGSNGFGYDPVFVPDGSEMTFAEMTPAEKNRVSHRSMALQKIRPILEKYLVQGPGQGNPGR
jgi:XTP/dITP diphosphohydrolase